MQLGRATRPAYTIIGGEAYFGTEHLWLSSWYGYGHIDIRHVLFFCDMFMGLGS